MTYRYNINDKHLLLRDGKPVRYVQAADHSGRMTAPPQVLVIHYDAGNQRAAINTLTAKDSVYVSAHLSLGRDGTPVQMLPLDHVAWHAGDGTLARGKVPFNGKTLNYTAIGIECENLGWCDRAQDRFAWRGPHRWPLDDCIRDAHKLRGGGSFYWPKWPETQLADLIDLTGAILSRYPIQYIVGHDEVSPQKYDPGPAFFFNRGGMDGFRALFAKRGLT